MADGNTTWINTTRERVGQASNAVKAQSEIDSLAEADTNLDRILQDLSQLAQTSLVGKGMWWTGVDAPADLWKDLRASQSAVEQPAPGFCHTAPRLLQNSGSQCRIDRVEGLRHDGGGRRCRVARLGTDVG